MLMCHDKLSFLKRSFFEKLKIIIMSHIITCWAASFFPKRFLKEKWNCHFFFFWWHFSPSHSLIWIYISVFFSQVCLERVWEKQLSGHKSEAKRDNRGVSSRHYKTHIYKCMKACGIHKKFEHVYNRISVDVWHTHTRQSIIIFINVKTLLFFRLCPLLPFWFSIHSFFWSGFCFSTSLNFHFHKKAV